jgi:hypothetical protein
VTADTNPVRISIGTASVYLLSIVVLSFLSSFHDAPRESRALRFLGTKTRIFFQRAGPDDAEARHRSIVVVARRSILQQEMMGSYSWNGRSSVSLRRLPLEPRL